MHEMTPGESVLWLLIAWAGVTFVLGIIVWLRARAEERREARKPFKPGYTSVDPVALRMKGFADLAPDDRQRWIDRLRAEAMSARMIDGDAVYDAEVRARMARPLDSVRPATPSERAPFSPELIKGGLHSIPEEEASHGQEEEKGQRQR